MFYEQNVCYACKHTWWNNGRQEDVHLTPSVATTFHTPYYNPPRPAKANSI